MIVPQLEQILKGDAEATVPPLTQAGGFHSYSVLLMKFQYDDGGRSASGYKGNPGDCVCRSIAIATEISYQEVYDALNQLAKSERRGKRKRGVSSARNGVYRQTMRKYLLSIGWKWTPTKFVGKGFDAYLTDGELPDGHLIVSIRRHITAVIDSVIHDKWDPQRYTIIFTDGNQRIAHRPVYGYWSKEDAE